MIDNNNEIIIRYDLDEYIENTINGLSDEECQEAIDSVGNGYFNGIITPEHVRKYLCNYMRKVMLKSIKE